MENERNKKYRGFGVILGASRNGIVITTSRRWSRLGDVKNWVRVTFNGIDLADITYIRWLASGAYERV